MLRAPISARGVDSLKYETKAGCRTSRRYASRATAASSSKMASYRSTSCAGGYCDTLALAPSARGGSSCTGKDARSTPPTVCSKLRRAISGSRYFHPKTSPCSVSLKAPRTDPGGKLSMARWAGPPPRPMDPPRPWNTLSCTPWRSATFTSLRWARYRAKDDATMPASLLESE